MNIKPTITAFIKKTNQVQFFYLLLIAWTIVGFSFWWDNNMQHGCIIYYDGIFSIDNIFFTTTSITLLTIGLLFQTKGERLWFFLFELLFWLIKLFYVKGGYAVGLAGAPMFSVLFFDMVALCLRLMLLNASLQFRFSNNYILIPLVIIFYIKLYYF